MDARLLGRVERGGRVTIALDWVGEFSRTGKRMRVSVFQARVLARLATHDCLRNVAWRCDAYGDWVLYTRLGGQDFHRSVPSEMVRSVEEVMRGFPARVQLMGGSMSSSLVIKPPGDGRQAESAFKDEMPW